jgi:hypothetical protein
VTGPAMLRHWLSAAPTVLIRLHEKQIERMTKNGGRESLVMGTEYIPISQTDQQRVV